MHTCTHNDMCMHKNNRPLNPLKAKFHSTLSDAPTPPNTHKPTQNVHVFLCRTVVIFHKGSWDMVSILLYRMVHKTFKPRVDYCGTKFGGGGGKLCKTLKNGVKQSLLGTKLKGWKENGVRASTDFISRTWDFPC